MELDRLYQKLEETDSRAFYQLEADFCAALFYQIPQEKKPPCVTAFLTMANWFAMSQRSGVWTFYEAWNTRDISVTLKFLEQSGQDELAAVFASGIHDYQAPQYTDGAYPEEWFRQAREIDKWIDQHEQWLFQWERDLLLAHKAEICPSST